jgi:hypothetical protein
VKTSTPTSEARESWGWWGGGSESGSRRGETSTSRHSMHLSNSIDLSTDSSSSSPTPESYLAPLRSAIANKRFDAALVKKLISLRVQLSTAKIGWVERFVRGDRSGDEDSGDGTGGMEILGEMLRVIADEIEREKESGETVKRKRGGKKSSRGEEVAVVFEVMKCLRVLLNTEVRISVRIWL